MCKFSQLIWARVVTTSFKLLPASDYAVVLRSKLGHGMDMERSMRLRLASKSNSEGNFFFS